MIKWLRRFDEIISPHGLQCLCCDEMSYGEILCPTCSKALKVMGLSAEDANNGDLHSIYRYEGVAKKLVLLLKADCTEIAARALATGMAEAVNELHLPPDTVMTWVTMPKIRRMKRGIDHGYELCKAVSQLCGFPVRQLLGRTGRVHTQRGLSREKRLINLNGTFRCDEKLNFPVLLIDDVLTTGATSSACAKVLLAAGATSVHVLTATRAMGKIPRFEFRKVDTHGFYPS